MLINKKLSVVIPVYFNEKSLHPLHAELTKIEELLLIRNVSLELIFVDDGSKDDSLLRLLEIKGIRPETKIIKLTRNFGANHCSKTGFKFVTGDAFMSLAADLQDPPSLIIKMVDYWLDGEKFVICERLTRQDPLITKLYSKIYYKLLRLFVIPDYPEGGFDLALMDKVFLPFVCDSSKSAFTPLLAYWVGYKPKVIKYERAERQHGKSKWTFSKKFSTFLDVMLGFSITPIRAISGVGVSIAVLSFIYGGYISISALFYKIPVPGFATVVALITFLLGLIIIMLGVLGEYLWRIFEETNHRPNTVIEEVW